MFRIILITIFSCFSLVHSAQFKDCGSKVGSFDEISVSNCNKDDERCPLLHNTNSTIQISFAINQTVKSVKTVVHGILSEATLPFPIPYSDACKYSDISGLKCPLSDTTQKYQYTASLPIRSIYPKINVNVKWELQNENKEDIVCIIIPVEIK